MKRHVRLFEEFSEGDAIYVVELLLDEDQVNGPIYVFLDEADQEAMYDEILEKSPNLEGARRDMTWHFVYEETPDYMDLGSLDEIDPDEIYDMLEPKDRERVDKLTLEETERRGRAPGYVWYEIAMYIDDMPGMLDLLERVYRKGGRKAVERRFVNLEEWAPKGFLDRLEKIVHGSEMFGV